MPYDHDFEGRVSRARLKMPKVCNKCYLSHRRWEKVHPVSNIITRSTRFILCALMHICSLNLLGTNLICPEPKLMQLFVPPPQAGALKKCAKCDVTDTAHKKVVQYKLMLEDGIVDVFAHYEWKFHPEFVYGDDEGPRLLVS